MGTLAARPNRLSSGASRPCPDVVTAIFTCPSPSRLCGLGSTLSLHPSQESGGASPTLLFRAGFHLGQSRLDGIQLLLQRLGMVSHRGLFHLRVRLAVPIGHGVAAT